MINPDAIYMLKGADLLEAQRRATDEALKRFEEKFSKRNNVALVTTEVTKETLSVSDTTLWRWKKSGYLVPVNVGGQCRYRVSDINEILEGKK